MTESDWHWIVRNVQSVKLHGISTKLFLKSNIFLNVVCHSSFTLLDVGFLFFVFLIIHPININVFFCRHIIHINLRLLECLYGVYVDNNLFLCLRMHTILFLAGTIIFYEICYSIWVNTNKHMNIKNKKRYKRGTKPNCCVILSYNQMGIIHRLYGLTQKK